MPSCAKTAETVEWIAPPHSGLQMFLFSKEVWLPQGPRSYNPSFKHDKYHASPGPSPTMDASQSVQLQFDLELRLIMFDKPVEIQETCFAWSRTVFVLALGAFGSWIAHPMPILFIAIDYPQEVWMRSTQCLLSAAWWSEPQWRRDTMWPSP